MITALVIWNVILTIVLIRLITNVNGIHDWINSNLPRFRKMYQDYIVREASKEINGE